MPFVANHLSNMKVGYREVGQDEDTPLYPEVACPPSSDSEKA
jgi:hypothetical protein